MIRSTAPLQRARVEYHLDEKGIDLFATLFALSQWGDRWMPPPDGPARGDLFV